MNQLPQPGTEAFNKLGAEARTLSRWADNYTAIHQTTQEAEAQATLQEATQ